VAPEIEPEFQEFWIYEILEGNETFKGLIPLIQEFMTEKEYPKDQVAQVNMCLQFVLDKSKGRIPTGAHFIRQFVL
jgi:hypothetical protein